MFDGLGTFITASFWIMAISVPLGIWKLLDLIVWAVHHIKIS
ncbi:hypothetical protein [uncultured Devosia sp.]|nr:hypothetical protein [uncultured Devosia sp.]